jgi:hypothetical protein
LKDGSPYTRKTHGFSRRGLLIHVTHCFLQEGTVRRRLSFSNGLPHDRRSEPSRSPPDPLQFWLEPQGRCAPLVPVRFLDARGGRELWELGAGDPPRYRGWHQRAARQLSYLDVPCLSGVPELQQHLCVRCGLHGGALLALRLGRLGLWAVDRSYYRRSSPLQPN